MKSILFTGTVLFCLSTCYVTQALADTIPPTGKIVNVHAQDLFVPVGFDDNDEIVVVLDGYLPDTCYKITPAVVTRDLEHNQIMVDQQAREFPGICYDMVVPFTTVVKVGVLPQGEFSVVTNLGKMTDRLPVKRASSTSPDDYLYAPIDSAQVVDGSDGGFVAVLNGRFTNSCATIDRVIVTNHQKTIEVMPVMKIQTEDEAGVKCVATETSFRKEVPLPAVGPGNHLLHVRSLDGQSVNVVFRGPRVTDNQ